MLWKKAGIVASWVAALAASTPAGALTLSSTSLNELTLEQLGNIEITSVSRRGQRLSDAPTSVFVITADDIRRSGAASLPEALRLAPNLQVARSSNLGYTISARALDSALSNKLLVLIDGRSVYTPLYSGVFWDAQDLMLEDIDRIEVISGPGATLWGVNAVNGVINVITRGAEQRSGRLVSVQHGERQRRVAARSGGSGSGTGGLHYSVYGLHHEADGTGTATGAPTRDAERHSQAGLRIDTPLAGGSFTLIGDVSQGRLDQPPGSTGAAQTLEKSGTNLLLRYERPAAGGMLTLQAYGEHTRRNSPPIYDDSQDIVDLQLQHTSTPLDDHLVSWGMEVRRGRDRSRNSFSLAFLPPLLPQTWHSIYLQDDMRVTPTLQLTFGLRAESNDYTGTEYLPSVRAAWKPVADQLLWAAAARAARAPARLDRDFFIPGQAPFVLRGGPGFRSEVAEDLELGWRGQLGTDLTASVTAFQTRYSGLRSAQADPGGRSGIIVNGIDARSHGIEAWGSYQPMANWRLHAGVALLRQRASLAPGATDARSVPALVNGNPSHWWLLRSSHDFGDDLELDIVLRGVGARAAGTTSAAPSYRALNLRLGWRVLPALELSLGVRDLADSRHVEYGAATTRALFEPEAYLRAEYRF